MSDRDKQLLWEVYLEGTHGYDTQVDMPQSEEPFRTLEIMIKQGIEQLESEQRTGVDLTTAAKIIANRVVEAEPESITDRYDFNIIASRALFHLKDPAKVRESNEEEEEDEKKDEEKEDKKSSKSKIKDPGSVQGRGDSLLDDSVQSSI